MSNRIASAILTALLILTTSIAVADDPDVRTGRTNPESDSPASNERGRRAIWSVSSPLTPTFGAWASIWKRWGLDKQPADFAEQVRERYGLVESPRSGDSMPLGLKKVSTPFGSTLGHNCLLCHAGRIAGQTVIGLGNASLDLQSLVEDLTAREPIPLPLPFRISNGRGIIEASAGTIYLMQFRDPQLRMHPPRKLHFDDGLCHDLPAWWLLRHKKTMFHTGGTHARSVRANLSFFLNPLNSAEFVKDQEPVVADILAGLRSLEPPGYPFPIDRRLAFQGEAVFVETCSHCHGTYGKHRSYPNRIIPLDEIGTDPVLASFDNSKDQKFYRTNWLYQETGPDGEPYHFLNQGGYQAPPLDGVWATAPYFHNGSVPTIAGVLDSGSRPRLYTRSFSTEKGAYDQSRVGWKISPVSPEAVSAARGHELRRITDTRRRARGKQGHTFGDDLSPHDRQAVIEYLKTL